MRRRLYPPPLAARWSGDPGATATPISTSASTSALGRFTLAFSYPLYFRALCSLFSLCFHMHSTFTVFSLAFHIHCIFTPFSLYFHALFTSASTSTPASPPTSAFTPTSIPTSTSTSTPRDTHPRLSNESRNQNPPSPLLMGVGVCRRRRSRNSQPYSHWHWHSRCCCRCCSLGTSLRSCACVPVVPACLSIYSAYLQYRNCQPAYLLYSTGLRTCLPTCLRTYYLPTSLYSAQPSPA